MKSGSKKKAPARPPELTEWQHCALQRVAASRIATEAVFGGGAALATLYLHHRRSEDLDFFLPRELEPGEAPRLVEMIAGERATARLEVVGPRTSVILRRGTRYVGRVDFAFYPFDPVGKRTRWRGLLVESIEDMTVNKLQAVLTRNQPRDFVDLYFLLREGPLRDPEALLDLVRAKFDAGPDLLGLASRLLLAEQVRELPRMIRPLERAKMVAFFEGLARRIVRSA